MSWFSRINEIYEGKKQIGQKAEKTGVLPIATGPEDLFNVVGGRVLLTGIAGQVTDIPAGTAATVLVRLQHTPTTGAAVAADMCDDLDVKGAIVDTLLGITGDPIAAMFDDGGGGVAIPSFVTNQQILQPGTVSVLMTEGAGAAGDITGEIVWTLLYQPIDDGAVVVAA